MSLFQRLVVVVGSALALGVPGGLGALGTTMGPYGIGAAYLGAGGAGVATARGSQGLTWNPAAGSDGSWDLEADGAVGGPAQTRQEALVLDGPLDQGLAGGLLLGDQSYPQAGGYREDTAGLALSADLGPWLSVGTIQRLDLAAPGALMGWSMDVGALARVPLGAGWKLNLGVSASDLASSLTWGSGLVEQQPSVLRAGAAVVPLPGTWVSFEEDQLEGPGGGGVDQWRLGAQVALLGRRLLLRAGATQAQGDVVYATAGLGACLSRSRGLEADYAILAPAGASSLGAQRQALSLVWRFGSAPARTHSASAPIRPGLRPPSPAGPSAGPPKVFLARELRDGRGRVRWASIALAGGPADARSWTLELKDRRGRVVRILRGRGLLPPALDWDGRDSHGRLISADGLSFVLRVARSSGPPALSRALLAPAAAGGLGSLSAGGGPDFALRRATRVGAVRPAVVLRGGPDLELSRADFDLRAVPGGALARSWELRVVDPSGRTVSVLRGRGPLPKDVRWDGTDDYGAPVAGAVGASFELRITGRNGRSKLVAAAPVLGQAAYSRLSARPAARVPRPRVARDPRTGQRLVTFYFARGGRALTAPDREVLAAVVREIRRRRWRSGSLEGFVAPGEGRRNPASLAQARADAVLKALLNAGAVFTRLTAVGRGVALGASSGGGPRSRALDRRVELRLPAVFGRPHRRSP